MSNEIPVKQVDPSSDPSNKKKQPETVDLYASRKKIYVKEVKGFFQRIRNVSLMVLMGMYFLFVWLTVDGQPLIHFDLPAREFHLFGLTFFPKDFFLLSGMLIICAFGLFFITTLFGRVWCGYTCPQTVWTFVFMWIEEKVEGSRNKRMKLDKSPNTREKITKKGIKHALWLFVALATGLTFVGYFYPIRELIGDIATLDANGWAYFWVGFFTVATYLNAGWMREQVCLYMCPYARFQSVMFDPNTRVVSYDPNRGEPRGKRKKGVDPAQVGLGDCIDCEQCVQVCPTGIDIRDGLQYECIGCALCIDACDQVMDKMDYPRGLIRYTTENELEGKTSKLLRPRTFGYGAVLTAMIGAVIFIVASRVPAQMDVLRDRGALYSFNGEGRIENSYTIKIQNMSEVPQTFVLSVEGLKDMRIITDTTVKVASGENRSLPTVVDVPPESIQSTNSDIRFIATSQTDSSLILETESRFVGPRAR
ncbi:cytochrome c oxidase accessory protein CcoG [Marinobacter persicus]|jgi:cytochrome c oxidase accessory protein FixG|uniref:Cytochrome c oxidase accessory protein FixG n=1 Tax=Marinobacter persicus TaxID=930118 RepID=A0A2S6G8P6_9GAMM|nr:cytochrome c oxidase accessory protein CcoG [Marinobacter persicus]PPK52842.1 cytochrome c oxidase accessory protein FixG [Marinobacter persicus]PPK55612.1 cytochrome c oxidase accessory protein FixG [Marinobacter persicus]PPK59353.1 cytochrome c oxidase accessory protein FixG [Marinobacter persicus]